jgi:hypothetical protein
MFHVKRHLGNGATSMRPHKVTSGIDKELQHASLFKVYVDKKAFPNALTNN